MNRIKSLIEKLMKDNYLILKMPFTENERINYYNGLKEFFNYAYSNQNNLKEFQKLKQRKDQGSLLINTNKDLENLLSKIVKNSEIIEVAKQLWSCDKIYYSSSFSHYRMVDPDIIEQMNYQVLHIDHSFLSTKSLNICLPATAYGREFPGIEIFSKINPSSKELDNLANYKADEPYVELGEALIFPETTPHQRTVLNKSKIRLNTEFRIFPDYTNDIANRFNLKEVGTQS